MDNDDRGERPFAFGRVRDGFNSVAFTLEGDFFGSGGKNGLRQDNDKRKQQTLKRLTEKASERNPDEFYFSMARERTENGVAVADRVGSKSLSVKEIKPLKMQDVTYLRTMRNIERRRIERLQNVTLTTSGQKGTKIVFAENTEEGMFHRFPCSF